MACLPVRGCSGTCDEQPLHIQPGHRRVASLCRRALAALAVPRQRALPSSRHSASQLLGRVRPAGGLPAAVALVAAVRVQLSPPHRLASPVAPAAAGLSILAGAARTSSLRSSRGSNLHCVPVLADRARKIFSFRKDNPAGTERTLALVPRAKPPHCLTAHEPDSPALRPLHSLPHPLHRLRGTLPLIPTAANFRDSHQSCAPVKPEGRATSSGQQNNIGARRCLSPKTKQ